MRIVRTVAIHRCHDLRLGRIYRGHDRCGDALILLMADDLGIREFIEKFVEQVKRPVLAAVVHEYEIRRISGFNKRFIDAAKRVR